MRHGTLFEAVADGVYRLVHPDTGIQFDVSRLHWERSDLHGELEVSAGIVAGRAIDGPLSVGTFNFSSTRARQERASYLARLARTDDRVDWLGLLEELSRRVIVAYRSGQPSIVLRDLPRPEPTADFTIEGVRLHEKLPTIFFADGGSLKSYLALYLGGRMAQRGKRVVLFDWELSPEEHRDRLERIFGPDMPAIAYVRCERPLTAEVDRLKRTVRDKGIDFAIYDSIAFACDGPPEASETAVRYGACVRQIGVGSLHIAHTTKGDSGDQKPFGSVFWHNLARSTYYVQAADTSPLTIALHNRKSNLGPKLPAIAFAIDFGPERTTFTRCNPADVEDIAAKLPIRERMKQALRYRPMTMAALAREFDCSLDAVEKAFHRDRGRTFVSVPNPDTGVTELRLVGRNG